MMHNTTARVIRNTNLFEIYKNLLTREELTLTKQSALLKVAVILLNNSNSDARALGYRIIVLYSNYTLDYEPLYDVALNNGYIPIVKYLDSRDNFKKKVEENFFNAFYSTLSENYRSNDIYYTNAQLELSTFFQKTASNDVVVVAPTSYGKSELFTNFCLSHPKSKICMVVPTKALLAQTKKRLLNGLEPNDKRKIITHPEMYSSENNDYIAILTQERALRLFQKHPSALFDFVFIDEAHNLLSKDQRNLLLAKVIILLKNRNKDVSFKYLTPFLVDTQSLSTKYTEFTIKGFKVSENLKTEKFYHIDFRDNGKLNIYDQYFDKSIEIPDYSTNEIDFIKSKSASKNIIYLNSPPKVEKFIRHFSDGVPFLENDEIKKVCVNISEFLHNDYLLIECLKKGIIYHHGAVPDIVKLYIEDIFSNNNNIKYIVTTSTLLEGVNIPAQKLFILDIKKGTSNLNKSQFKNLVGRICRFKEIFSNNNGNLSMLEPEIYLVGTHKYLGDAANLQKFIKKNTQVDLAVKDNVENILLEATKSSEDSEQKKREADEYLENITEGITGENVSYASTEIGKLCFLNNISEIDILFHEERMQTKCEIIDKESIREAEQLLLIIVDLFIPYLRENREYDAYRRLSQGSAQKFYTMFLSWRMKNASYAEMINKFLGSGLINYGFTK